MANPFQIFTLPRQDRVAVESRIGIPQGVPSTSGQPTTSDSPMAMLIDGDEEQTLDGGSTGAIVQKEASPASSANANIENDKINNKKMDLSEYNLNGLNCPICMEPWTSQGDHQVCCLPCGHIFGLSCINKWIQHSGGYSAKCPQCNAKIDSKDVRKLYASPVTVIDENLREKIKSLEAENISLKTERTNLVVVQDNLLKELRHVKRPTCVGNEPLGNTSRKAQMYTAGEVLQERQYGLTCGTSIGGCESLHCNFVLEHEMAVDSARLFDMDAYYQIIILARRISGMGGTHILNKINLINPDENEDIKLPPSTKAVKDLRISPCGRLALTASLGKKLSILSMGGNNVVITYDLPGPAWSCSWDLNSPHYMYTGLQNGTLLVFDMRKTVHPVQSMDGLNSRPIHTINSFEHKSALFHSSRKLLTASSIGPCVWNTTDARGRPFPVPELENKGLCISLAYSPSSDDIVATFRPKIQLSLGTGSSPQHSPAVFGRGSLSTLVVVKRVAGSFYHNLGSASAHLGDVLMSRSAIINVENCLPLFAYGDDVAHGLTLRELPSLAVSQNLKPHEHPILDVKYSQSQGSGLLGCISEDKLQLFSAKVY